MLDPQRIDQLAARLAELAERSPLRDLKKNARVLLQGFFHRLDFVSREEFDSQRAMLEHTRSRLEALEQRLAELEARR